MQHQLHAMNAFAPFFVNSFHVKIGLKRLTSEHSIFSIVIFFYTNEPMVFAVAHYFIARIHDGGICAPWLQCQGS